MGTLSFTVGEYARTRGSGAATAVATDKRTSGSYTSTTSASFVEDAGGDITLAAGEIFRCVCDEAAWIVFGGDTAAVGTGWFLPANVPLDWECKTAGKVSIIDVA